MAETLKGCGVLETSKRLSMMADVICNFHGIVDRPEDRAIPKELPARHPRRVPEKRARGTKRQKVLVFFSWWHLLQVAG